MSNLAYKHYVKQNVMLAQSLIIKSEDAAIGLNNYIIDLGYEINNDPKSWKYYLNLSGNYHFLDTPIYITSLDTRTEILFDKEMLRQHPKTKRLYTLESRFYKTLVREYPEQELLIRGILNPINIDFAISAKDHEILSYDKELVESTESGLMDKLQERLYNHSIRWNNKSFLVVDDLYFAAYWAQLLQYCVVWLLNIRLSYSKTNMVHSYHVKEYLRSNGNLDQYIHFLNDEQRLYLYRNLRYIQRNMGKDAIFKKLLEMLFTKRSLGLTEYQIKLKTENILEVGDSEVQLIRHPLNQFHTSYTDEETDISELVGKQSLLGGNSIGYDENYIEDFKERVLTSNNHHYKTKVLESSVVNIKAMGPLIVSDFITHHWLYWSLTGHYNTRENVVHPRTNRQFPLYSKEVPVLYFYLLNKVYGMNVDSIPPVTLKHIRKESGVSREELAKITPIGGLDEHLIETLTNLEYDGIPIGDPVTFVINANKLYLEYSKLRPYMSLEESGRKRGYTQAAIQHLYKNVTVDLLRGQTFDEWLHYHGFELSDLTVNEYKTLLGELEKVFIPSGIVGTFGVADIQRAMVNLLKDLSSYSTQVLREVNMGPIIYIDWPVIRTHPEKFRSGSTVPVNNLPDIMTNLKTFGYLKCKYPIHEKINHRLGQQARNFIRLDLNQSTMVTMSSNLNIKLPLAYNYSKVKLIDNSGNEFINHDGVCWVAWDPMDSPEYQRMIEDGNIRLDEIGDKRVLNTN